jgi:hypothetical protein
VAPCGAVARENGAFVAMSIPGSKLKKPEPELTALDLERLVSVPEAARLRGVSPTTIRRYHRDKIVKVSPNREGIPLKDVFQIKFQPNV